jgi:uncharacterized protein YjiK
MNNGIEEHSGINTFGGYPDTIKDQTDQMNFAGDVQTTYPFVGDDLEGIAFDPADHSIWVVEEGRGQLVHLTVQGQEIFRTDINYQIQNSNKGFEGLCLRTGGNGFYALVEANPATIVHIDSNFNTAATQELDFATDVSGICPGRSPDEYFIVSHEEQQLYEWSWTAGVLANYPIAIEQAEGVAYDSTTNTVYIVCDATAQLYSYHFVSNSGL